jgi:SAM-dependent methyltransferase
MRLLPDDELERSAVVANCRMNRERGLLGSNGYGRELGLDPLDFLKNRPVPGRPTAWLDLCCGSGKALIEAATLIHAGGLGIQVIGVDLVGMFQTFDRSLTCLQLVEAPSGTGHNDDRHFQVTSARERLKGRKYLFECQVAGRSEKY